MLAILDRPAIRWPCFLAILLIEIIAITAHYEVPAPLYSLDANAESLSAWLFDFSREYWQAAIWVMGACLLMLTPNHKTILDEFAMHTQGYRWPVWLTLHLLSFAAFATVTALIFEKPADPARLTAPWFSVWFALASATFALWLLTLAPNDFWLRLVRKNRTGLLVGVLLGVCAWMLFGMLIRQEAPLAQKELWLFFSGLTLKIVFSLLGWLYSDLIYEPGSLLAGTPNFPVVITYACSGIEGVSLIIVFLAVYLGLFRNILRFPQALWLFPLGIITIWLANALRIAILIIIGSSFSPEVAMQGFHAQAGWIAFTLIALGTIALSHRMRFFTADNTALVASTASNSLATALIVPLVVQMAALMLTSAFSSGFDWLYPARIGVIAAVLYYYRKAYSKLFSTLSWQAPAIGIVVFIVWMLLEPGDHDGGAVLSHNLEKLSSGPAAFWLAFRTLGSVIVIPLAEELAFRGYLIRKLIAKDFENVPNGRFSWLSFILSSLLFGLLHDRWLAGTLAGMCYAIALYRRGQLGDAVIAHMTTNALIAIVVLTQGRWALWT
jgi:exosortase E/protease (VPEID-CTERM system)